MKRTTVELDQELVARAKRALGLESTRATVEEALRRVAEEAEQEQAARAARQRADLRSLSTHLDLTVLGGDQMWSSARFT